MTRRKLISLAILHIVLNTNSLIAQIGNPFIHDPSTIVECEGDVYKRQE